MELIIYRRLIGFEPQAKRIIKSEKLCSVDFFKLSATGDDQAEIKVINAWPSKITEHMYGI